MRRLCRLRCTGSMASGRAGGFISSRGLPGALMPRSFLIGPAGEAPDRWLLAIEAHLPIHEQVALYAHALGHLLLNNEQVKMDRLPALDPKDGDAHRDMLAELPMLETTRQPLDRRVLETYPLLT